MRWVKHFQSQYPLPSIAKLPAEMRWDETRPIAKALDFPQTQILGVYEDEGYLLHEQKDTVKHYRPISACCPCARTPASPGPSRVAARAADQYGAKQLRAR